MKTEIMKIETMLPCLILLLIILSSVFVTYMVPKGSWVVAYYPFSTKNIFQKVAPEVDFIATVSEEKRTATVFISTLHQKIALEKQGAILIDPEGVPLCQQ